MQESKKENTGVKFYVKLEILVSRCFYRISLEDLNWKAEKFSLKWNLKVRDPMVPQLAFLKKRESAEVKRYDMIAVGLAGSRGSDT